MPIGRFVLKCGLRVIIHPRCTICLRACDTYLCPSLAATGRRHSKTDRGSRQQGALQMAISPVNSATKPAILARASGSTTGSGDVDAAIGRSMTGRIAAIGARMRDGAVGALRALNDSSLLRGTEVRLNVAGDPIADRRSRQSADNGSDGIGPADHDYSLCPSRLPTVSRKRLCFRFTRVRR